MLGIFDGIINQYFYVKTELYPAVQCVKAKILLLLVGMFFVKHERWLPIFYDSTYNVKVRIEMSSGLADFFRFCIACNFYIVCSKSMLLKYLHHCSTINKSKTTNQLKNQFLKRQKTEIFPAVQCVKAKILMLLVVTCKVI